MIAKLIVHEPSRRAAAFRLAGACGDLQVWPVRTNAAFLARAAADADFVAGNIDTGFIERHADRLVRGSEPSDEVFEAAARALLPTGGADPWTALSGFRVAASPERRVEVEVAGHARVVVVEEGGATPVTAELAGETILFLHGEAWNYGQAVADHAVGGGGPSDGAILSPMPGRIVSVDVAKGDRVSKGQKLLVLEAMKMEQGLLAPFDGIIGELNVKAGAQVAEGVTLARIEKEG
jgi:3-methylcrotonyl-CoA carboxylase alpha subunit